MKYTFADDDSISEWAQPFVAQVAALSLMQGDEHGYFQPKELRSVDEAYVIFDRLLGMFRK